jgi:ABC-2 type transport system permease protein
MNGLRTDTGAYGGLAFWAARQALRNRPAFVANTLGALIQLLIAYFLWRTYFAGNAAAGPYDEPAIRLYLLVALVVNSVLTGYDEWRNALRVLNGDVAMDLVRPVRYGGARLIELAGTALAEAVVMTGVAAVLGAVLGGVRAPDPALLPAFLLTAFLALLVKAQVVCAAVLLCFGRDDYLGLHWIRLGLMALLAGTLVPIDLYPPVLREIALALPPQAIVWAPFQVLVADGWGRQVAEALTRQAAAAAAMFLILYALERRAMRLAEATG